MKFTYIISCMLSVPTMLQGSEKAIPDPIKILEDANDLGTQSKVREMIIAQLTILEFSDLLTDEVKKNFEIKLLQMDNALHDISPGGFIPYIKKEAALKFQPIQQKKVQSSLSKFADSLSALSNLVPQSKVKTLIKKFDASSKENDDEFGPGLWD